MPETHLCLRHSKMPQKHPTVATRMFVGTYMHCTFYLVKNTKNLGSCIRLRHMSAVVARCMDAIHL